MSSVRRWSERRPALREPTSDNSAVLCGLTRQRPSGNAQASTSKHVGKQIGSRQHEQTKKPHGELKMVGAAWIDATGGHMVSMGLG